MQRGARFLVALPASSVTAAALRGTVLLAALAAGCVDLARPPELVLLAPDSGAGGAGGSGPPVRLDGPSPSPSGNDPDGGPDVPAVEGPGPDAALPIGDAPRADDAPAPAGSDGGVTDAPASEVPASSDAAGPEAARPSDAALPPDAPPPAPDTAPPPPDAAPPDTGPPALVIDNFQDGDPARNTLAGSVITANQIVAMTAGEGRFVWNGAGRSQDFAEYLRADGCGQDTRIYRTLRFRMRASVPNKMVFLVMGRANATCALAGNTDIGNVTLGTTMATYDIDLTSFAREGVGFFQWVAVPDATVYFIDDIELIP